MLTGRDFDAMQPNDPAYAALLALKAFHEKALQDGFTHGAESVPPTATADGAETLDQPLADNDLGNGITFQAAYLYRGRLELPITEVYIYGRKQWVANPHYGRAIIRAIRDWIHQFEPAEPKELRARAYIEHYPLMGELRFHVPAHVEDHFTWLQLEAMTVGPICDALGIRTHCVKDIFVHVEGETDPEAFGVEVEFWLPALTQAP